MGGASLFSVDIAGSGIATVSGIVRNQPAPTYHATDLYLSFAPTPEPATVLLLGTGITALAFSRWRR
jgi:hypothetical protein